MCYLCVYGLPETLQDTGFQNKVPDINSKRYVYGTETHFP